MSKTLYIVIPCYNEQEVLPETAKRLLEKLQSLVLKNKIADNSRIMFVNDESFKKQGTSECSFSGYGYSSKVCRYDRYDGCRSAG